MTDPYAIERDRQTQDLTEAIDKVIQDYGRSLRSQGKAPMLNAVAGALTSIQGGIIASVEDRRIRKMLRKEMERLLPAAIAAAEGRSGKAEVIYMGGTVQ